MSGPLSSMVSRMRAGVAAKSPPPGYPITTASVQVAASPCANCSGGADRSGTSSIEMSACGSYDTTYASYVLPSTSTVALSAPATTCAFDITRLGATTNPVPSSTFWHPGATPRIFTTLGRAAATTGSAASAASGASTATIGV